MKQKIKIMKQHQQPSDEEIQSYMNFDRLLDSRKVALSSTRTMSVLKWSIPALTVTALIVVVLFGEGQPTRQLLKKAKNNRVPQTRLNKLLLPLPAIHQ